MTLDAGLLQPWWLLLLPLPWLWLRLRGRRRQRHGSRPMAWPRLLQPVTMRYPPLAELRDTDDTRQPSPGSATADRLAALAMALMLLALAQPVRYTGPATRVAQSQPVDLVLVVGTAISMTLRDYVIDGKPYATPTVQWREGDHVYWHGSSASRMLKKSIGHQVCLTVALTDGFVMGRSAMHHSVNYRSAMIFGEAYKIEDPDEKAA